MCRADLRADALAPDPGRLGPVRGVAVAGGELRDIAVVHEGVRPYEAGVDAEINERACGAQHPSGLVYHRGEVVDIRVREHRDDGVEALVLERERRRVDLEHLDPASPGELELGAGDVDPGHRPPAFGEGHGVRPAAAPKVEQPARAFAEQAENAFAAAGCHGMSAIVALTAQNTTGVTGVHEVPPDFVRAQLEAVFDDLGVDAAKTGMLFSAPLIETVADFLEEHPVPLVVDPVLVASSGARLLQEDAVETLVERLFPLATVITPNLPEAHALAGEGTPYELAERLYALGARAVIVTGGHGDEPVDHLFDGEEHVEIPVARHRIQAT